jgi:hypothetical protein
MPRKIEKEYEGSERLYDLMMKIILHRLSDGNQLYKLGGGSLDMGSGIVRKSVDRT